MGKLQVLAYFSIIMPRLISNSMSMSLRMLYLSCVKMRELHCPAKTETEACTWRVTQCQRVGAFIRSCFYEYCFQPHSIIWFHVDCIEFKVMIDV